MVYTKLISGLGNQLFQYAVGRHLSLIHNVPLKLDITFFNSQDLRSFKLQHFNIKAEVATDDEISKFLKPYQSNNLYFKSYRKILNQFPKYQKRYFREEEWWVYEPDLFKVSSKVYIEGYWQHYKYFENLRPEILEELTIKESNNAQVSGLLTDVNSNPESVAVHIRRGDYITDLSANKLMGVLPLEYYISGIKYMKQHLKDPLLYIFSDDLQWAADNLKSDLTCVLVDIEGGKKDYVELDIMSKCSHQIIANSSFSWWGAFLNQKPNKIVVAPKQWVLPEEINQKIKLQLPTWIRI